MTIRNVSFNNKEDTEISEEILKETVDPRHDFYLAIIIELGAHCQMIKKHKFLL